jgi:iron complex transport system substrate-binding protein
MAARAKKLAAAIAILIAWGSGLPPTGSFRLKAEATELPRGVRLQAEATGLQAAKRARIVSLVPALTEMLFAIGAGSQVVGVSSFDAFPAEVKALPRVGALLDPDVERILSLRPTLVLAYGSQTDLHTQLARAGIKGYVYRHGGIDTIFQTMGELGDASGRRTDADRVVRELRARLDAVRTRVSGRPRPRVLLVFDRQPKTLREIYVSGGRGFLNEMLEIAGGRNVFAEVARESVQPSLETLIARAPGVILEVHAEGMLPASEAGDKTVWSPLSSVPAVKNGRVYMLSGQYLVVPGPRFAQATETLARTLHPGAFR